MTVPVYETNEVHTHLASEARYSTDKCVLPMAAGSWWEEEGEGWGGGGGGGGIGEAIKSTS